MLFTHKTSLTHKESTVFFLFSIHSFFCLTWVVSLWDILGTGPGDRMWHGSCEFVSTLRMFHERNPAQIWTQSKWKLLVLRVMHIYSCRRTGRFRETTKKKERKQKYPSPKITFLEHRHWLWQLVWRVQLCRKNLFFYI